MFSWICPTCGRENQPSQTECPRCAEREKAAAAAAPPAFAPVAGPPPTAPLPQTQVPAQAAAPPPPAAPYAASYAPPPGAAPYPSPQGAAYAPLAGGQYAAPPGAPYPGPYPPPGVPYPGAPGAPQYSPAAPGQMYYAPAPRRGLPTWLMSIVFTLAFGGLLAGGYLGYQRYKDGKDAPTAEVPPPEAKSSAKGAAGNPILKQIEVGGLRITQGKDKKPQIRFLLINHSAAELGDLSGTLQLMAKDESVGSCNFKMSGLGAYEAKEVSMPLNTKMQAYELPDWQFLRAELSLKTP